MKYLFSCNAVRWFDRINGNTYHSVRVTKLDDGKEIVSPMQYGYGDSYRQTALKLMLQNNWLKNFKRKGPESIPCKEDYTEENIWSFERENNYPILWNVSDGLKRECIANGKVV